MFDSLDECLSFKKEIEIYSKIHFVTRSSSKEEGYTLYKCRYDKAYHSKQGTNEREPKLNNVKLPFNCPSFFSINNNSNHFKVRYCAHHTHKTSSWFLYLSPEIKNEIEAKLRLQIPPKGILSQLKEEFPDTIVTLKDIENVKEQRNIENYSCCKNDRVSCQLLALEHDSIRIIANDNENIQIFVQTKSQKKLMADINVFGLDSTHCTTRYGFYLTTLHAIQKNKKGFPVAHFISTNEKQDTIESFLSQFQLIKNGVTLITDDFPAYTNAWTKIFGQHNHVQCFWHLKKNWRISLNKNQITGKLSNN